LTPPAASAVRHVEPALDQRLVDFGVKLESINARADANIRPEGSGTDG